jgi:hypothetical protein
MTGAVLGWLGGTAALGASGVVAPSAPAWSDIYGEDYASTNSQTISGITSPISITLAKTGGGALSFVLNGAFMNYTGAFTVVAGDIMAFGIAVGLTAKSGTITVTNVSNGSATLATINYVVTSSGGGGGRGIIP